MFPRDGVTGSSGVSLRCMGSFALLVGTFLSPPLVAAFSDVLTKLKTAGYRIALDTGWPPSGWTDDVRAHFADWLGASDALLTNESETLALGRTNTLDDAVENIRRMLGPGGVRLYGRI
jgi:sugar/nucleoside kinase (ribokinase family)